MLRTSTAIVFCALLAPSVGLAADLTPDAAYDLAARPLFTKGPPPEADQLAAARKVIEAQAKAEPKEAKWVYALGRIADVEGGRAQGDERKAKRKEALEQFEKAAELKPGDADYQYWIGSASFDHIDDVNLLSQMSLASKGRKAFEKAIELDPSHVAARVGLATFYIEAPSIAGGSPEKAKVQAEGLLTLPGKRGEFQGRMVLARLAGDAKKWDEMLTQLRAAETAGGDGADPMVALRSEASLLLTEKKDAEAAAPIVERYRQAAPTDDISSLFLTAELARLQGRCADAVPKYDQVLAKVEGAKGSRWGAAVCKDQLGQKEAARLDYAEFLNRFPNDDRVKDAKAALKRLQ
ncbi:MAG TPA: TRAP transporter TatT component family protein [Candidatus Polarisedimenticolaceae bacterium]|nr:TRAP transporter TatT component family protein [Candidatus Polarisedimenticolaceae bacterium]